MRETETHSRSLLLTLSHSLILTDTHTNTLHTPLRREAKAIAEDREVCDGVCCGGRRVGARCETRGLPLLAPPHGIFYEKGIALKLSGDEIYYTAYSLLAILENSCGELHCQKVLNLNARLEGCLRSLRRTVSIEK